MSDRHLERAVPGFGLYFASVEELAEALRRVQALSDLGPELIAEAIWRDPEPMPGLLEGVIALPESSLWRLTDAELDALHSTCQAIACDVETEWSRRDDPEPEGPGW